MTYFIVRLYFFHFYDLCLIVRLIKKINKYYLFFHDLFYC